MKIKILDTASLGEDTPIEILSRFGELETYTHTDESVIYDRVADADVIVLNKVKITDKVFEAAENLKLVCVFATGYDNIDLVSARKHGVGVCNVPGYSTDSVALYTVATVLSLACRLREYDRVCRSGSYSHGKTQNCLSPAFYELSGKTWGVVGLGSIGTRVASVASALGCRVIGVRRRMAEPSPFETVSLEVLCREADVITLHTPLTEETRGIISRKRISEMKTGVILVNAARGAVVDEAAVAEAALSGKIFYGADVYSTEPYPVDHPYAELSQCDNVLLTPHMAWGAYEARCRCLSEVAENIRAFQEGRRRSRVD